MASEPVGISEPIRFGDDLELDAHSYQLRRSGCLLKLERIPMDLLLLLVEQRGQLVTREQIIERVWGRENESANFSKDSTKKPGKAPGESEKKSSSWRADHVFLWLGRDDEDVFRKIGRVVGAGHLAKIVDALTHGIRVGVAAGHVDQPAKGQRLVSVSRIYFYSSYI